MWKILKALDLVRFCFSFWKSWFCLYLNLGSIDSFSNSSFLYKMLLSLLVLFSLCLKIYLSWFSLTSEGKLIWQTQLKFEFIDSTMISWLVQSANGNLWVKDNKHSQVYGFVVFRSIISLVCSLEHFLWLTDLETVFYATLFWIYFLANRTVQYNLSEIRIVWNKAGTVWFQETKKLVLVKL